MSHVTCTPQCLEMFEAIRKSKDYRYIIFRIVSDALIDVETVGSRDSDYSQFVEDLMRHEPIECRYGLFDLEYNQINAVSKQEMKRKKLVLLSWCPDEAKAKGKIQYQTCVRPFMDRLKGAQYYKTVCEAIDLSRDAVEAYFSGLVK